jgi:hypothetical protein
MPPPPPLSRRGGKWEPLISSRQFAKLNVATTTFVGFQLNLVKFKYATILNTALLLNMSIYVTDTFNVMKSIK